jgi:hypothetical protein
MFHNQRFLIIFVLSIGFLILVGASTLTIFAFKKFKNNSSHTLSNISLAVEKGYIVKNASLSGDKLSVLLEHEVNKSYKVIVYDITQQAQVGQFLLNFKPQL